MKIALILVGHWYLSLFCQTFFLHRYASHGMFKMSLFWERFFYFLTWLTQGTSFLNPAAYANLHIRHHQKSDTPDDPHSPHNHKDPVSMMLATYKEYAAAMQNPYHAGVKPTHNVPQWALLDRIGGHWLTRIGWIPFYGLVYWWLEAPLWAYVGVAIHSFMGPIQGALVNWCGHRYGYQNFDCGDKSRNTLFIDMFLMGEFYQNNHHRFPKKSNFAVKWFEFDPTYPWIWFMRKVRIIVPTA